MGMTNLLHKIAELQNFPWHNKFLDSQVFPQSDSETNRLFYRGSLSSPFEKIAFFVKYSPLLNNCAENKLNPVLLQFSIKKERRNTWS
jgi:hypothetical protein